MSLDEKLGNCEYIYVEKMRQSFLRNKIIDVCPPLVYIYGERERSPPCNAPITSKLSAQGHSSKVIMLVFHVELQLINVNCD